MPKAGKPTADVKNIFSRDVIKNPLKGPQASDEQRAIQSSKPPPANQQLPEPGEVTQPINSQLSFNRPVEPPKMPNFNHAASLSNPPFGVTYSIC